MFVPVIVKRNVISKRQELKMAEIEKKWYVLRAISGKEAKVKEYLEADLKNLSLIHI